MDGMVTVRNMACSSFVATIFVLFLSLEGAIRSRCSLMLTALYGPDDATVAEALRRLIAGLIAHRRLREASSSGGAALAAEVLSSLDSHADLHSIPDSSLVVPVQTKYYSAEIPVRLVRLLPAAGGAFMSSHPSLGDMAGIVASSEGILLLLPHRSTEAEREVRLAFERLHAADASASASGEQLRIAVTVGHTEEDEEGGDSFQARMEWCLDHQFELLHVPLAGDAPLQGWSDREKEGLPRLVEALESHLWSSMRRRGTEVEEEGREAVREKGGVGETKGSIGPHPHREEVEAVTGGPKAAANAADEDPELKEVGVHADRSASFGPYNSSGSGASMPGVGSRSDGGGGGKINSELPTAYALRKLVIFEGSGSQENGEDDVGCELVLLGYCRVRVLLGRVDLAGYTVRGPAGSLEEAVRAFQVGEAQEKASYLDVFSPSTTALLSVRPQKPSPTSSSPSPPVAAVLELSELPRDRGEVGNASYLLSHRSARFFATDTLFDFSEAAGPVSCHAFGLPCQGLWSCFPGLSVRVQALHRSKYRLSCHAKAEDVLRAGAPAASLYRSSNTHPAVAGVLGGSYSPLRSLALGAAWYEAAEAALLGDRAVERGPGTIASVADTSGTANSAAEVLKVIIGRRVVVCGGVKQGKSSFARFLVNRAFQCVSHPGAAAAASPSGGREGIAVAYVDLDPGQTEFSAPGLFSLSIVTSPLLGPPFSHAQSSSCCCCGRGIANASTENISNNAMSIVDGPVACTHLFYFGSLAVDGSGVHRIAAITNTIISLYLSRYAHMPLIVNTMGWVDGLGLESLLRVLAVVRPDAVCAFPSANAPLSGSVPLHRFPAGAVPRRLEPELGRRYAYLDDAVCEWIATQSQKTSMLLVSRPEPEVAETGGDTPVQFASARAYKRSKMPGGGSITGCGASPAQLRILMWQACFLSHASLGDPSRPPRTVWDARPLALRAALAIPLASQQLRVVSVDPTAGGIMRDEQASLLRAVLRPNEVLAVFTHTRSDLYPQGREDPSVGRECCGVCVVVSVDDLYLRVIAPWRSSAERAILETIAAAAAATEGGGAGLGATGPTGSAAASSLLLLRVLSPRSGGGALVMPPEVSGVQAS